MNILLVCSSLEKGKDGIGDYSLRLAKACQDKEANVQVIAINDKFIQNELITNEEGISIHRFPSHWTWARKKNRFNFLLKTTASIDWISIQFVLYGFNPKGLLCKELLFFKSLSKKAKVHVMMHELWLGEEKSASPKRKLLGWFQKQNILFAFRILKPTIIQTSIQLYAKMLASIGLRASVLPIFSNIGQSETLQNLEGLPLEIVSNKEDHIIGCFFGSIYYQNWDLADLINYLKRLGETLQKRIVLVSIGKVTVGESFWNGLINTYPDIKFVTLGSQSTAYISTFLRQYVDFGIITTPAIIAGKSGSYMAFKEHEIPVFCKKNDLEFDFELSRDMIEKAIIQVELSMEYKIPSKVPSDSNVVKVAEIFLNTLHNHS